jgi:hypothetical protein
VNERQTLLSETNQQNHTHMMMIMIRCNAISALVEEEESAAAAAGASSACVGGTTINIMPMLSMLMVRCRAMSWTDKEAGLLRVLVARRDLVTNTTTVTEEQAVQHAHFTGTVAEKRFMERRWCERHRQAMLRVNKHKSNASIRAVERAAKRQCKKDERQTEALLARMRNWTAHMFDVKCAISVTCKAALVEECLKDARAVAKSADEKLPWLECLPKGIRESERLAGHLKRWEECCAKVEGEFMVVLEAEHENKI